MTWYGLELQSWSLKAVDYPATMLQKVSKCEVKPWLCWNLIILLPLWFYVKTNFGEVQQSKNVIFVNSTEFLNFEFWYIWDLKVAQIY